MDPARPETFNHRTEVLTTWRKYHFVDQLPENYDPHRNPTILCVHGFPDFWYGWRYQIGPWVRRGCRVVVPDMLGYGGSSKPEHPAEYTTKRLCADLAALLDLLKIKRAIVIGHDWGSFIAARFALWHPDRLHALVLLSVPYTPPSRELIPLTQVAKIAPNLTYQLYFASPRAPYETLAHLGKFLALLYGPPDRDAKYNFARGDALEKMLHDPATPDDLPIILNDKELKIYIQELQKGMHGPLNYYRTSQLRHEEEKAANLDLSPNLRADLPVLFIWGTQDPTVTPSVVSRSHKFIKRYQDIAIEGRGHWLMVEAKDEITETIANWLEGLTSKRNAEAKL